MKLCISNGLVIDPSQKIASKLNIGIQDGKISEISQLPILADEIVNAEGCIVTPAFIDCHMHEGRYDPCANSIDTGILKSMLKMGVGTAIGCNCGDGCEDPIGYLDWLDEHGAPINLGLMVPHNQLRHMVGAEDKYSHASEEQIFLMKEKAQMLLEAGCVGISFGIRYVPGIDNRELTSIASALSPYKRILAAHIRDDAGQVFSAARELLDVAETLDIPVQVSHIGSMGAFGQMDELLSLVDSYKVRGVNVAMDCYPYSAFSTGIGETTYDEGFLERYKIGYESIEVAEGEYKGKRLTKEIFDKLRKFSPETITIGHVMDSDEVDTAIIHPSVIVASDGFLHNGMGHPRAAGTFPRFLSQYVRESKKLSLYQAIEKITWMPAVRFGIKNKGSLRIGSDADITIFRLDKIKDRASFEQPVEPPVGIERVIINGQTALLNQNIVNACLAKTIRL